MAFAKPFLGKTFLGMAVVALSLGAVAAPAVAQVRYAPGQTPFFGFFNQPYDESYDTQPTYQIFPYARPDGGPVVRVIQRCAYIGGWNVGDFDRSVNGVPLGIDHTCPSNGANGGVQARY